MSYTYHGTTGLITLPGREVQTFPSGLVRVTRSYVCRRGQDASFRPQFRVNEILPNDDGAPAIDGFYIFPDPQEITRDDGFTEFRVTAYGRTNASGTLVRQEFSGDYLQNVVISASTPNELIQSPVPDRPAGIQYDVSDSDLIQEIRDTQRLSGRIIPPPPAGARYLTLITVYRLRRNNIINYGFWNECQIEWRGFNSFFYI